MPRSLLELMPEADRKKAIERGRKRLERQKSKKGLDVSPEIYLVAEFGYYFGWEGVMAIKRGYIEKHDSKGEIVKDPFTLDEALVLLEGARKVWYTKLTEQGHSQLIANTSAYNRNPGQAFNNGIKPFTDRADITE